MVSTSRLKISGPQKVELPTSGDNILQFQDFHKMLKTSFAIYSDFETLNIKIDTCVPIPNSTHTIQSHKLDVCGFGYEVVCEDSAYTKPTVVYRGPDASTKLIECLLQESAIINDIMSHPKDIIMTPDDTVRAKEATTCCLCNKKFSLYDDTYNRKVRHHNHMTGAFIGMAHNKCNLKCTVAKHIPVIFHNLKKIDAHILCESIGQFKDLRLSCIAQTGEKYASFSQGNLRFIDSFQFLPSSLETQERD